MKDKRYAGGREKPRSIRVAHVEWHAWKSKAKELGYGSRSEMIRAAVLQLRKRA